MHTSVGRDALIPPLIKIDKPNCKVYNPDVERKEAQK